MALVTASISPTENNISTIKISDIMMVFLCITGVSHLTLAHDTQRAQHGYSGVLRASRLLKKPARVDCRTVIYFSEEIREGGDARIGQRTGSLFSHVDVEAHAERASAAEDLGGGRDRAESDGTKICEADFHGERRSNQTHASTTGPDARLYRKGSGNDQRPTENQAAFS